jgi:hypothetical protein
MLYESEYVAYVGVHNFGIFFGSWLFSKSLMQGNPPGGILVYMTYT